MKDRKQRVRYKSKKVSSRNRLSVFKSNNHIYAQLIDDTKGITLASSSSVEKTIKDPKLSRKEIAEKIGKYLGLKDYISFEKDRLINDTIYPADSLDMLRDFQWQPTRNLDDFLPETIEWYREHLDHFRHRI